MALDPNQSPAFDFTRRVERYYAALIPSANSATESSAGPSLGGHLLYAGQLGEEARALVVAANIAGAATLIASADAAAQRQAIRDGVTDFLVNSLSEALRILKNEIRKRQPVAVCVAAPPEAVEREMIERGVAPDLLLCDANGRPRFSVALEIRAQRIALSLIAENQVCLQWHVAAEPARWLPKLDAIALDCLPRDDASARRWLRLAPRYLGRLAQGVRVLSCKPEAAKDFKQRVQLAVERGEIGVPVEIGLTTNPLTG
jgi:urocanate hydratase